MNFRNTVHPIQVLPFLRLPHFSIWKWYGHLVSTPGDSWACCISCSTLTYLVQYMLRKLRDFLYIYIYIYKLNIYSYSFVDNSLPKNRLVHSPLRYECRKWVEGWSVLDDATPLLAPWPLLTLCTHFQWLTNENQLVIFSKIDVFTTTINTTRNCMKMSLFTKKFMTSLL